MAAGAKILLQHARLPATLAPGCEAAWLAALPAGERVRLGRFDPARRLESLAGLALLARVAGAAAPALSDLRRDAGGKPHWPAGPAFSIAHAAGHVACALAPAGTTIGIDLEPAGAASASALRRVLRPGEREALAAGQLDATWLWACKEAVLKAAGAGLKAAGEVEIRGQLGHHAGRRYVLQRLEPAAGLVLALALDAPATVEMQEVDAGRLFSREG